MSVVKWDAPKKVMTEATRRTQYSSDCEVPGTFVPNMSDVDRAAWKGKITRATSGNPQGEIRKDSTVIVVSLLGGYLYKYYTPERTKGINLHIASAGALQLNWKGWDEMQNAVREVAEKLGSIQGKGNDHWDMTAGSPIVMWNKPKRIMSEESRRKNFSSDSEVPGTYVPNMSAADVASWKGKLVRHTTDNPQVELRKDTMVIVVSLRGGYKYKYYTPEKTSEFNIHIAIAGPAQFSWKDWADMRKAISESAERLALLNNDKKAST